MSYYMYVLLFMLYKKLRHEYLLTVGSGFITFFSEYSRFFSGQKEPFCASPSRFCNVLVTLWSEE